MKNDEINEEISLIPLNSKGKKKKFRIIIRNFESSKKVK